MASLEQGGLDDSFAINPETQAHQGNARDDEETTHHSTHGSSPAAESSPADPIPPRTHPFLQEHLPVFHHLDKGGRISKIDSLRYSRNEKVDLQSQGLFLVSSPAAEHVTNE